MYHFRNDCASSKNLQLLEDTKYLRVGSADNLRVNRGNKILPNSGVTILMKESQTTSSSGLLFAESTDNNVQALH